MNPIHVWFNSNRNIQYCECLTTGKRWFRTVNIHSNESYGEWKEMIHNN